MLIKMQKIMFILICLMGFNQNIFAKFNTMRLEMGEYINLLGELKQTLTLEKSGRQNITFPAIMKFSIQNKLVAFHAGLNIDGVNIIDGAPIIDNFSNDKITLEFVEKLLNVSLLKKDNTKPLMVLIGIDGCTSCKNQLNYMDSKYSDSYQFVYLKIKMNSDESDNHHSL